MFQVNGKEYPIPADLTLGEMCDAERYFGVEFGENATSGVRMASALLWITIRRDDPTVTVDDIRNLPMDVFADITGGDAGPPAETISALAAKNGSSGVGSEQPTATPEADPSPTGVPS